LYLVTQFNHPREITDASTEAVKKLLASGVIVNNQAVLMKGVNDEPEVLAELMDQLVRVGIIPYYVFQCRPVKRVKEYFQIPLLQGVDIVERSKKLMNGFSKRFKYAMSHRTGKIEILGRDGNRLFLKYHQAKDPEKSGNLFTVEMNNSEGWLTPELLPE
jgi:L-lysine 2,3-aminomutase